MSECILDRRALVLNRSWVAISTTTVRQALVLLYKGAARAVDTDTYEAHGFESWAGVPVANDEPSVATVEAPILAPEVIQLTNFDRVLAKALSFSRRRVLQRDRFTCQYCGAQPGAEAMTIDHVQPRSRGGPSSWENCVAACERCNRRKGDRTPGEARLALRTEPRAPSWSNLRVVAGREAPEGWKSFVVPQV